MQLQISCNLSSATGRISNCMCRMQLKTSYIRQLQNAKFLVVKALIRYQHQCKNGNMHKETSSIKELVVMCIKVQT
jgi:hypothetical protein